MKLIDDIYLTQMRSTLAVVFSVASSSRNKKNQIHKDISI